MDQHPYPLPSSSEMHRRLFDAVPQYSVFTGPDALDLAIKPSSPNPEGNPFWADVEAMALEAEAKRLRVRRLPNSHYVITALDYPGISPRRTLGCEVVVEDEFGFYCTCGQGQEDECWHLDFLLRYLIINAKACLICGVTSGHDVETCPLA